LRLPEAPPSSRAGLDVVVAATVNADRAAVVERPLLVVTSMMPAVRRPYSAGSAPVISSTLPAIRGLQRLAEDAEALREDDPVQPVLSPLCSPRMWQLNRQDVLGDARRLQDHLVQRRVLAAAGSRWSPATAW